MSAASTRRVELILRRPRLALYAGIRPTVVIDGRGQPAQWGRGTWQLPADVAAPIAIYLFARWWRFGAADIVLSPADAPSLVYAAPRLPFGPGRLSRPAGAPVDTREQKR
jgi:hypothetical protein